ncbi:efflux RND transporter periplasmic adaptor subunit [Bradyrhizobium erythrophlei]|jgi:RND family efflux transporter MFP subunit|uniref:RND family efflux transporter, MFP subunit n=1 Tax=Bradyrhizobium erythrophlei TaxID=1437360 RepID=A0A1M5KH06_9BRAD|nr:efflux RND transporter periplasmic adaptor subunit [Bradyrhizobium erythrophlei]SHG52027.1 RND family efflux transporter, MFP subunit [Bradyrhizobium erythrophlei]
MNDTCNRQREPAVGRKSEKAPNDCPDTQRRWSRLLFGGAAFLLLAAGLAFGTSRSYSQQREVIATADHAREFVPSVRVATVGASPGNIVVTLPATTAAFADANIYARATGYIGKRNVDIGDHVKQGELLVELGVPELDDQIAQNESTLEQLKAAVQQAEANSTLAQATWGRDKPLLRDGWVTGHQGDIDLQTVKADEAAVSVAQANVVAQERLLRVLHQNRAYASVVAPFDGIITQRNVDVGSLVQGNANTGTFMFEIMQKDVIRVRVYVPQDAAFGVAPGVEAIVRVPEIPGRTFRGEVTRIAEALQTGTRTLLTEIDISNPDGALQPGTYCTVDLNILRKTPSFLVPADATIFNQNGMQVAVVKDGTAHIHKVSVMRDFGTQVEVDDGVEQGDLVIINPPIALSEGSKVRARAEPAVPRT